MPLMLTLKIIQTRFLVWKDGMRLTLKKEHKNPKGGLTEAGRKYFKRTEGSNLKAPVKEGTNPRRVSLLRDLAVWLGHL